MIHHSDPPIPHWPGLAGRSIDWARPEDFATAPLRRIFAWWNAHTGTELPRREDFDITAFGDIAENLYIIASVAEGYELRLAGEEYIRLFGIKKGWIWQRNASDPVMRDSAALLTFVAQAKRPLRTIGRLELIERHWIELEALICPLRPDADGGAKFLGCTAAIPRLT
ncbi:PAS domain-containing protein [Dongia sp.]|uniref:PAS domain-containing protein n=1 Tax=Dongia sp. TaxID=1977262 RepID=UPI0035B170FB